MKRVAIMLSVLMAVAPSLAQAEVTARPGQESDKKMTAATTAQTAAASEQTKQVSLKVEEGDRITLRNRFGPIVVTGTGGDSLEATVTEIKQGTAPYTYRLATTRGRARIAITTAVTTSEQPSRRENKATGTAQGASSSSSVSTTQQSPQTPRPVQPVRPGQTSPAQPRPPASVSPRTTPARPAPTPRIEMKDPSQDSLRGVGELRLEVKLPHNAHIDLIDSRRFAVISTSGVPSYLTNTRNDVYVTNMETPVSVVSSGDVQATRVGGLEAKTRASSVFVKDVSGSVNITTVTGSVVVKEAQGDVRVVSISGPISIECAKGRAEAGTTNGSITLMGIGGDLDVNTTGGTISYTGEIREGGRYRLKSISGVVRMFIQREPPGFLASLSSYKGQILLDFELKTELSANTATPDLPQTQGQPVRRLMGRYGEGGGEGDARITLDSFSGAVQLARAPTEVWKRCR